MRHVPPLVIDTVITVVVYVVTLAAAVTGPYGFTPIPVVLALGVSAPLLWRRRCPIGVAIVVGMSTTLLAIARSMTPLPLGSLVATYTFAAACGPLWRMLGAAGTTAGVLASMAFPVRDPTGLAYVSIAFVTAYALGTATRARHARIDLLVERTLRLEEERKAAAATERARIARDVHDVLAHAVSVMVVQAEAGQVATDPAAVFDRIAAAGRTALAQI
ncbi:MAG: histidine kinase, partial [Dactylosporangium sp.]|nr:histidine kinase [Dactylosporangium sp.]